MITAIRQLFKAIVSVTVLAALIIIKKLYEDFGILSTGKREAEAIHIMNTFKDSRLVLLIYRLVVEVLATFCISFAVVQAVFGSVNVGTVVTSSTMSGMTFVTYISYRKTLKFFRELEEKIIALIRKRRKECDTYERKTGA